MHSTFASSKWRGMQRGDCISIHALLPPLRLIKFREEDTKTNYSFSSLVSLEPNEGKVVEQRISIRYDIPLSTLSLLRFLE